MISIDLISNFSEFQNLRRNWEELRENDPSEDMVFLTHGWMVCWWQAYSNNNRLFVLVARENDLIVGIAPLMISKVFFRGLPVRLLSFIDNGNSGHNNFLLNSSRKHEILEKMINYILDKNSEWDVFELKRIPPESNNFQILHSLLNSSLILWAEKDGTRAPYLKFNSDWQSFFNNISRKSKKTIRNIENRIQKRGDYRIQKIIDFEGYEKVKHHLYNIAKDSWQEDRGNSLNNLDNRDFFFRLTKLASSNNWLLIWILYLNEEPVAFEYHLKYRDRVHGLRSSYKETYRIFSPGAFLDYHIIKSLFENGAIREYDMGGGYDFYKRKWTKNYRKHITLHIFNRRFYSKLVYAYEYKIISILRFLLRRNKKFYEEK